MPSPDDSFYNIKRLHVVFALSSATLLGVTVWMLAVDHGREWKGYQRTFQNRIEPWLTQAQIQQEQSDEFTRHETELQQRLERARSAVLDPAAIEEFRDEILRDAKARGTEPPDLASLDPNARAADRSRTLKRLAELVAAAKLRLDNAERELRFRRADLDEIRSSYESAVGQGLPQTKLEALQREVDAAKQDVARLTARKEDAALHHDALSGLVAKLTAEEDQALRALAEHRAKIDRMRQTLRRQTSSWGKKVLSLPLIDALGSPLSVDQVWLPELTIDYNFAQVARFDRCTTCHVGIDKAQPGQPSVPACPSPEVLALKLPRPPAATEQPEDPSLEKLYGLALAPNGILDPAAPTVGLVLPRTPAADALLLAGDVFLVIDGHPVETRDEARMRLIAAAASPISSGAEDDEEEAAPPIELKVRRGLPQPYCAHPRLDLFVGSLSPHPVAEFGCTICHEGQGSATEFRFASHTPNDPTNRRRWQQHYDWFGNEHWDLPMRAARFAESSCLRCHHDVTDLEPGERFPDPPAPKLLQGYHLVRRNGCFGCHEINGVDGSGRRIGPDMRLEPNYHEAALELLASRRLDEDAERLARRVVEHPEESSARRELVGKLLDSDEDRLTEILSTEAPNPGTMRKVGPSLRDTASKLDAAFMESWIADPTGFRPSTRMPHFFGLHEHLEGESLRQARRFEAVEVRSVTEYLLSAGQPVPPLGAPPEVTESPSAERGKELFLTKGCAACHRHEDYPKITSIQGPDLTRLGSKITSDSGRRWLVSWIRDPARHSPRTTMPNALLEPVPLNADGSESDTLAEKPRMTDPAADIAAWLLESDGWQPGPRTELVEQDLNDLAFEHLSKAYPQRLARQYLGEGIPENLAGDVEGDARELIGPMTLDKKLRYVGRRTIRKRGCFGCHDIPGFEDAQPIGPALSDWGRKEESLLAFNQVHRFLALRGRESEGRELSDESREPGEEAGYRLGAVKERSAGKKPRSDDPFYLEAIHQQRREGFIWQKLRAPRSFDYQVAPNKPYNEQLTMGRFALTDPEREAIATFVLGLVADPPVDKYVYRPDRRGRAIVEGRNVLDQFGCAECHTMEMERWKFQYDPDEFEDPFEMPDFEFAKPHFTAEQGARSLQTDRRGLGHAEVVGMPRVDEEGELLEDEDDDGNPLYFFTLWEPAAINGQVWTVGGAEVMISEPQILERRPPRGGAFSRLLYPFVLDEARAAGSTAAEMEAWGWVPPPLVHEGDAVEPSWLYEYLLNPVPIRPAVVLRMPRYHLSPLEAAKLVDYFAAVSQAEFPYTSSPAGRVTVPSDPEPERLNRFDKAMRLVTDRTTYCAKCHIIGDYSPGGDIQTILGPDLEQVGRRLRPDYLRRWLANPKSVLPYTGMPVNFPPEGPPMGQDLYEGSSPQQLDAVRELLLNYDWYLRRRTSVREWMDSGKQSNRKAD